MGRRKQRSASKRIRFWGKRLLYAGIICMIYFTLWRPARIAITEQLVAPQVIYWDTENDGFSASMETGSLLVKYEYSDGAKQLKYRPQFGFFFLIALLALLFVSENKRHYLLLGGLHLGASLITYLCLIMGAAGHNAGFILLDVVSGYLTPALSLALVPLVIRGFLK